MKVFVTGATGAIGRFVVPRLLAENHEVTALARTEEKAKALTDAGARAAQVSLFDKDGLTLGASMATTSWLNLATAIPPMNRAWRASAWAENHHIRTEGSTAVVDAALAAGVGRLIQESITFTYPDRGARLDRRGRAGPTHRRARSRWLSPRRTRSGSLPPDGRVIVLRFGAFYGPGSSQSDQIIAAARRHVGLVLGRPDGFVSSIHLDDAAAAACAALERAARASSTWSTTSRSPSGSIAQAVGAAVGKRPWL